MKILSDKTAAWLQNAMRKPQQAAPRRERTAHTGAAAGSGGWRQWQISVVDGSVRVRSGGVAWGGGYNATWPAGSGMVSRTQGAIVGDAPSEGGSVVVMWYTTAAPMVYEACFETPPTEPACITVTAREPGSFVADSGAVGVFAKARRRAEWTDCRILGTIHNDAGRFVVNQIQTAEIAVEAVVYPGQSPAPTVDPSIQDEVACGGDDFPSNIDAMPWAETGFTPFSNTAGAGFRFPSKINRCW